MDDPESETGLLALVYAAAWGFAEIRERLKRYEDTGAMPDVLEELLEGLTRIEKLGGWDLVDRWVKAASEGRLVELPCKFGDPIYRIRRFKRGKNWSKEAEHILSGTLTMNNVANVLFGDVMGKTVFLTREEATAALKGEDHGEQV